MVVLTTELKIQTTPAGHNMGILESIAGGATAGAFDVVGGLVQGSANRQTQRANADLQREFAQHGIQWRVDDAKRAGLHPLAALGSFPASSQALSIVDPLGSSLSSAGQNISQAIQRSQTEDEREMVDLQKRLLLSQIGENDARRVQIMSDIGLANQNKITSAPALGIRSEPTSTVLPESQNPNIPGGNEAAGIIELKPPPVYTNKKGDPSTMSGTNSAGEEVQFPGFTMWMPSGKGQESPIEMWSELPAYEKWGWIMENVRRQGPSWLRAYSGFVTGLSRGQGPGNNQPFFDKKSASIGSDGMSEAIRRALKQFPPYIPGEISKRAQQLRKNFDALRRREKDNFYKQPGRR